MKVSKVIRQVLVLLLGSSGIGLQAAEVVDLRMWRAPDHTRLVLDLSDAVEYSSFLLEDPHRFVVDIKSSFTDLSFNGLDFSGSPISGIRSGVRNGDSLRIVLDLTSAVEPETFSLAPNSEFGERLVLDLYDKTGSQQSQSANLPENRTGSEARRDIVVAISAGHGGEDPGSIGYDGRIKEKNVTLAISQALYERLEKLPGYKPVMIREGDYYVELKRRPEIARRNRADLFVAIHADWYRNSRARGVTVYALSGDRADRENSARVAEKENSADLLGGVGGDLALRELDDDVALTLVSLQMAWSMEQSLMAGTSILDSLAGVTRIRKTKVQQASLQVLNSPDIPSILIETGYLTNPEEAQRLSNRNFQERMALAIADGVANYFYEAPPDGTLVAWQKANGVIPTSYTVKRGDTLSEIAEQFSLSVTELKSINGLQGNTIQIGQVLELPGSDSSLTSEHKIQRGETLSEIAQFYRVSLADLRAANNLRGDRILIGQTLIIPSAR
ncbi:MAG: N-acetylmuramoyl-L-alanine amidase [Pseudohongiellaceae bacterium]|nr:LysM peptidoglycan-binding domain-containing protein [Gammaproteobacteria bacterium]